MLEIAAGRGASSETSQDSTNWSSAEPAIAGSYGSQNKSGLNKDCEGKKNIFSQN
jgi:hypothetical protein